MSRSSMKALVLHGPRDLRMENVPKPTASPGSVTVRVQATPLWDYVPEVIKGTRQYPLSFPLIFGTCCVGRIEEVGPDVTSLQPGTLVFCDISSPYATHPNSESCSVSHASILFPSISSPTDFPGYHGGMTPQEQALSSTYWKNGTFADFTRFSTENVHPISSPSLYTTSRLCELASVIPATGACNAISITAGETVLVLPSTGFFSSTAISAILALGANVIAGGRSKEKLDALVQHFGKDGKSITPVVLTGDIYTDAGALRAATPGGKGADAYIDYSPPAAAGTTHIEAGLLALKRHGRCCFAGVIIEKVLLPYAVIMANRLTIKGQFAQDRSDVCQIDQFT